MWPTRGMRGLHAALVRPAAVARRVAALVLHAAAATMRVAAPVARAHARTRTLALPGLLLLLCLVVALSAPLPSLALGSACSNRSAHLRAGDVLHVAVLVWVDAPNGVFRGNLTNTNATDRPYGNSIVQPYMLGVEMYVKRLRERGGLLPLPDGEHVKLDLIYINIANTAPLPPFMPSIPGAPPLDVDAGKWSYDRVWQNVPVFIGATVHPLIPGSFTFPGNDVLRLPPGLMYKVASTDPAVLRANFGIDKPFTFIIPPAMFLDAALVQLANLVEGAQSHIIIHPLLTGRDNFVCDGVVPVDLATGEPSRTPDCLAPPFNRKRRGGARRYNTLISTYSDATVDQLSALDLFHTLHVRSLIIIRDTVNQAFSLSLHTAKATADAAAQLNIPVLDTLVLEKGVCPGSPLCPPPDVDMPNAQLFVGGRSAAQVAQHIIALNPDALIILGQPGSTASWSIGQLFFGFQQLGWTPKAVSWGCGIEGGMEPFLPNGAADLLYTWNSKAWDPELRGPNYQNFDTDTNFELLPAVEATTGAAGVDGPAVFEAAYESAYGDAAPGGRHPMYHLPLKDNITPAVGWATMVLMQKMVEAAQSADVAEILVAAKSMQQPGMYGPVALDVYGRSTRATQVLQQYTPNGLVTLAPYNIGSPPVFPLPAWKERVFAPVQYGTRGERAVVGVSAFCIALLLLLLALVLRHRHAPVIRAATPSFCAVIICGAILMLSSNFFATLVVSDAHCAASTWLLTVGFTLCFVSLFIKTFRIWRIFGGRKLQVLKLKDGELLLAVGAFVLVDVAINAAWAATVGMGAVRVRVDPARPAYDYWQCDYSDGAMGAVYAHLCVKGAILLLGVLLTYSVRNAPSAFNESMMIGLAIYNTAFVIAFVVPILAVGIGGREANYQLRAYAIVFACSSCCGLLYVPKLLVLRKEAARPTVALADARPADPPSPVKDGARSPAIRQVRHTSVAHSGAVFGDKQPALLSGTLSMSAGGQYRSGAGVGAGAVGPSATSPIVATGAAAAVSTGPVAGPDAMSHYPSRASSLAGGRSSLASPISPSGGGGGGGVSVIEVGALFVRTQSMRPASLLVPAASPVTPSGLAKQAVYHAQARVDQLHEEEDQQQQQPGSVNEDHV